MKAEERLRYYASIFPLVEADAPYYYPPTEEMAGMWVNRTPAGFTMNIKSYSLFTNHPTRPDSLWPEVAEEVPMEHREKRSVYLSHLPEAAVDESWELFRRALMPLLGWILGSRIGPAIAAWDHWVACALLVGIGLRMGENGNSSIYSALLVAFLAAPAGVFPVSEYQEFHRSTCGVVIRTGGPSRS